MQGSVPSFFEGTEKKVELVVDPSSPSLRGRGPEYWQRVVEAAGAEILSVVSNDRCDAYLLSESSLFVFDHKMLMITCGRTRLPAAVSAMLDSIPDEQVRLLVYERKNEAFPQRQPTSFFDDAEELGRMLPGRSYRFGDEDEHHLYLFHLDRPHAPEEDDVTAEILMYELDPEVRTAFRSVSAGTAERVRSATAIDRLLPGFTIDDHLFEPSGYSLNGILNDRYWTVHVTPDEIGSYASIETNHRLPGDLDGLVRRAVRLFRPRSFDVIVWERGEASSVSEHGYRLKTHVTEDLSCGYRVRFMNFYLPQATVRGAVELSSAARCEEPR